MKINIWLILAVGAVILGVMIFVDNVAAKLMGGFILLVLLAYLTELNREEKEQIFKMQRTLDKLRNAYNELDEQAKIIIRTDLELNRTQEELDKKINGLFTLHELGKLISSTLDVQKLFAQISEPLILKLGFEKAMIFLQEKNSTPPSCKAAIGFNFEQIENIIKTNIIYDIFKKISQVETALLVKDSESTKADERKWLSSFGVASFVIIPMVIKETIEGFIFVGNTSPYSHISEGDIDLLFILSNQVAVALDNARLYEELKRSHDELEIRVQARTKELAEANKQLVKLNKMKSDFVSAVSHELRTPLTSIKGYAAILMAGRLGKIAEVQKEKLNKINVHSDELIKLVNDLLDIARIESGKIGMNIQNCSLVDIVKSVSDLFYPQTDEKQINLTLVIPNNDQIMVWVDQSQISRVFINLIGNALKFTPKNGKITITLKSEKDLVHIDITDSGIGISQEDLPKIFDEFYRVDNAINVEKKGTGLGLSLVKKIVEAHSGKIWVSSQVGKGTTFSFTLLLKKIEPQSVSIT